MTKAANRLGVAQPFLSKTIAALEDELGVELFDHVGRSIQLNSNGRFFYQRVSELLDSLDNTCRELKKRPAARSGGPLKLPPTWDFICRGFCPTSESTPLISTLPTPQRSGLNWRTCCGRKR